jgi:hypothetical protein
LKTLHNWFCLTLNQNPSFSSLGYV